ESDILGSDKDIPEAELPPRKRLCSTAPTSRYEVGESSTAAPRPTGGHRADYRLVEDGQFHYETARLLDREAYVSREAWAHSVGLSSAVSSLQGQLSAALGQIQALQARDQTHADDHEGDASTVVGFCDPSHNNMPPRRSSTTARVVAAAARAAAAAATPMTAAAIEQLSEARV
ncbi:hypothetical protein Tco_1025512, partial [Tanacetum coccineum]